MELEKRVEILEQELQVLKNQIQATLLEMQELLLTNKFPALRADAPVEPQQSMPTSQPRAIPSVLPDPNPERRPRPKAPSGQANIIQAAPAAPTYDADIDTPDAYARQQPVVRKVSGLHEVGGQDDIPSQEYPPASYHGRRDHERIRPQSYPSDPYEVDEAGNHNAWDPPPVTRNREARTKTRPRHSDRTTDQAHYGYSDTPNYQPARHEHPAPADDFAYDEPLDDMLSAPPFLLECEDPVTEFDWVHINLLEEWTTSRVERLGPAHTRQLIRDFAEQGRFSLEVRNTLLQLVGIIASDEAKADQNTRRPTNGHSSSSRQKAPYNDEEDIEVEEESQNVVLRLIAGIQNLGISRR